MDREGEERMRDNGCNERGMRGNKNEREERGERGKKMVEEG